MAIREISCRELADKLKAGEKPALLDVRFDDEYAIAHLDGAVLIPLPELQDRAEELEPLRGREVVVYCHHGVRSLHGAAFLESLGIPAASLRGGIDRWSREIDPTVPTY